MVRGIFTEEKATEEVDEQFCPCPFCACCFMSIQDLETHMAAFGGNKEVYSENFRRTHGKMEYGWTSFP
jgi:hypothetical protein